MGEALWVLEHYRSIHTDSTLYSVLRFFVRYRFKGGSSKDPTDQGKGAGLLDGPIDGPPFLLLPSWPPIYLLQTY